ncbi:hypothetical protein [Sphingomonas sp. LaA6.9]|uniref:hypothetical protein n=1 Tax=Sphingomonas sp. LaA6.9 TaxID=2919914 RepID=UPI001F4FEADD|nr:hypothetical protein [Sphingomonas sp. LaA6.9]MCJ8158350.1 hypothetical protein [Sphingomonas sp. LaA6.9]
MAAAGKLANPTSTGRAPVIFAVPPLTFIKHDALAYTGIAEKVFDALEKAGTLSSRRIGRSGARVYHRAQLDDVVARLFGSGMNDIDDEFEGIGG